MLTLPNIISLTRLPLALLFLKQDVFTRTLSLILAMLSDGLDGFVARKYKLSSRIGALLDPLTDRFFVFFVIAIFISEEKLSMWQALTLLCRDFSVILFGLYLVLTGKLTTYRFRAIWCGKVTTSLQFLFFLLITFEYTVPPFLYSLFMILGALALLELYLTSRTHNGFVA